MRALVLSITMLSSSLTAWGDDYKVIKLEQDVRNLERQVGELNRQLTALQRREFPTSTASPSRDDNSADTDKWVNAARWDRVRIGMSELEVIELLGKPSSLRAGEGSGQRILLYAMEIGSAGFLGGSIELRDRRVTAVNKPVLK
jgi:hypothetical protein